MASTEIPLDPCVTDADQGGTSIIVYSNEKRKKKLSICDIEIDVSYYDVILNQEPSETFSLTFSSWPFEPESCDYDEYHECCNTRFQYFEFSLEFDNYLHEMFPNCYYEVSLKALVEAYRNNGIHHEYLFTRKLLRKQYQIQSREFRSPLSIAVLKGHIIHLCIHVKRFCEFDKVKPDPFANHLGVQLLTTGINSDVSIIVGNKTFRVHKHVLALKSDVFKAMFAHKMSENEDGIVKIVDFNVDVIEEMLWFIYTGGTRNIYRIYEQLFKAAHKYEIRDLKCQCENYFTLNMNCRNVLFILDLANLYELYELEAKANSFISKHEESMVKEERYLEYLSSYLSVRTVVHTLKLCDKYVLTILKLKVFGFVKLHSKEMAVAKDFQDLFISHPKLMQEYYIYANK